MWLLSAYDGSMEEYFLSPYVILLAQQALKENTRYMSAFIDQKNLVTPAMKQDHFSVTCSLVSAS